MIRKPTIGPAGALLASCVAILLLGAQAEAQPSPMPLPAPYTAVAVIPPAPSDDSSLQGFRDEVAAVAKGRVYAGLERLVTPHGFFWDRDFDNRLDPRRPAVDNLAAALRLEHRDGSGWTALADFAAEPSAAAAPARPGVVCAPNRPGYDLAALDRLIDMSRGGAGDWLYPRADGVPVRTGALPNAAVMETLGLHFVRVLGYATQDEDPAARRTAWTRVATPSGKTGFVAPGALRPLHPDRLCYGKDALGRWWIAGFVGGGD